jgi:hypothetical protein
MGGLMEVRNDALFEALHFIKNTIQSFIILYNILFHEKTLFRPWEGWEGWEGWTYWGAGDLTDRCCIYVA